MIKSSTSFHFSSLLFFFIVASIVVYSEAAKKQKCMYSLVVRTGTVAGAETDSLISVTLGNSVGERLQIPDLRKWGIMSPGYDYFKNGSQDRFDGVAPCLTGVCNITVTSDGSGQKTGWFLEDVEVFFTGRIPYDLSIKFSFSQWLANDQPPYELTASRDECGGPPGTEAI